MDGKKGKESVLSYKMNKRNTTENVVRCCGDRFEREGCQELEGSGKIGGKEL